MGDFDKIELQPIGFVKNSRIEISDDFWGGIRSEITLVDKFPNDAFKGIEEFSHLEIIFCFDKVDPAKIKFGANHPRNNTNWPNVGIFAQRGKNRPNRIGLSVVKIAEVRDNAIIVTGLDAIDGTPILDIKPVIKEFLPSEEIKQPLWASELMKDYWKVKN
jgi:tRNA-Thr(GGU) m(6)t(6)A37 methyltransferase TsaA